MKTEITLPYPPSVNSIWRAHRRKDGTLGAIKSKKYRAWCENAGWEIKRQRPPIFAGPVRLHIEAGKPDKRKRDVSNLIKPLEDALVTYGVIRDDSDVQDLRIQWADVENVKVHIELA